MLQDQHPCRTCNLSCSRPHFGLTKATWHPQLQLQTCHTLQPVHSPCTRAQPMGDTACPAENSSSVERQAHLVGSSRCSSWMSDYPPGSREKGHTGTAGKGDGINRAESRGTHCYTQTPSTKSCVPRRSQMPQFFHQRLRAGNLSTFIIPYFTACFSNSRLSPSKPSSVSPAQISTCALHSPDSSRHLNQLPPICCPPQLQHPGPTLIPVLCTPPPTTSRQGQCPYTAFSGHLQTCKQAAYVVSSFADLQVSA